MTSLPLVGTKENGDHREIFDEMDMIETRIGILEERIKEKFLRRIDELVDEKIVRFNVLTKFFV